MPFQSTFARRLSILILVVAYLAALTPFTTYIGEADIILNMVIVIGLASIAMTIAGAYAAFQALGRDKHKFAIPARLQHSNTLSQWWIAFRHTRRYQWWLVSPRLGLAYAFVQWLHVGVGYTVGANNTLLASIYRPYFYFSGSSVSIYPQLDTVLIACIGILLFAFAEAGLVSALVLLSWNHPTPVVWGLLKVLLLRFTIVIGIFLLTGINDVIFRIEWYRPHCMDSSTSSCTSFDRQERYRWTIQRIRAWATVTTSINTGFDSGTLLAANIMRPIGEGTIFAHSSWECANSVCHVTAWDNRPFVLRQVVAGLLGLLMYGGLTGGVLWLSSKRASPP